MNKQCLQHAFVNKSTSWFIHYWLINYLTDRPTDWFNDWPAIQMHDWINDWLTDCLTVYPLISTGSSPGYHWKSFTSRKFSTRFLSGTEWVMQGLPRWMKKGTNWKQHVSQFDLHVHVNMASKRWTAVSNSTKSDTKFSTKLKVSWKLLGHSGEGFRENAKTFRFFFRWQMHKVIEANS